MVMTGFLLPAALLVLLAVAFAVSMLWAKSRGLALALALGLPLAAAGLYAWRGTPAALAPGATTPAADVRHPGVDIDAALQEVEARVAADPSDWEGWVVLGQARMQRGDYDAARDALANAHKLVPDDDAIGVGYAEALMRTDPNHRFPAEAVALLLRAAKANPPNERAVFFLGMDRMQAGHPDQAAELWETLLPGLDPAAAAALRKQIDIARQQAGKPPLPAAVAGPGLAITVGIDPSLAKAAADGGVLFVFARAPGGGGPPLAAKRITPTAWPVELTLTDADSPMPAARLSSAERVEIVARLSRSGDAAGASGDLESAPVEAALADGKPLMVLLARVRP
jgi:cytochrome c-type biogenesis protein CcmH